MARFATQLLTPLVSSVEGGDTFNVLRIDSRIWLPAEDGVDEASDFSVILELPAGLRLPAAWFRLFEGCLQGVQVRTRRCWMADATAPILPLPDGEPNGFLAEIFVSTGGASCESPPDLARRAMTPVRDATCVLVSGVSPGEDWPASAGFIQAPVGQETDVATKLTIAMATFGAPRLLSELDIDDVLPVLGNAESPSELIEALWLETSAQLVFLTVDGKRRFSESSDVAAFIYTDTWKTLHAVVAALRGVAMPTQALFYQAAAQFLVLPFGNQAVVVTLICGAIR